ncbi:PD-(D/E)XK nuclease family protein [Lacticaseibacillus brantae]|nr:PD-(D/E)XK nuclease family protein [Lacticaseibacillus brantae]
MSLEFIIGPASKNHTQLISAQIKAVLANDPEAQVFYLVPNHIKFESEVNLLKQLTDDPISVQTRLQVLSFSRLAWFYLKDLPVYQLPRLNSGNNTLLVAKILQDHKAELNLYQTEADHPGFVVQLAQQLNELALGRIGGDDLQTLNQEQGTQNPNPKKFADLSVLLSAYTQALGQFVTPSSLLDALTEQLNNTDLSHTYFYLNYFNSLNASELHLMECLIKNSAGVTVALTHNQDETSRLFHQSQRLLEQLRQFDPSAKFVTHLPERQMAPMMAEVEEFWLSVTDQSTQPKPKTTGNLTVAMASDPYAELRQVAREIVQKVHAGARYRDFLIMARHLDPYTSSIPAIFSEFNLPYFVDVEHPMANHPLVVLIDTLFEVQRSNYSYASMMRLLRTELLIPESMPLSDFRAALDVTDNHLLRTGMTGRYWRQSDPWQYFQRYNDATTELDSQKSTQINQIKDWVAQTVTPVLNQLKASESSQDAAAVLYQWLLSAGVKAQLNAQRQAATAAGDLMQAQAIAQVWQTVCDLLDDFVSAFGQQPYQARQFQQLLNAGFAGATFTQIPSTLDQVVISETGLTRLQQAQHVYVIGATSTVMPDIQTETSILTQSDRDFLEDRLAQQDRPTDQFLPATGPRTVLDDPFINYLGFMAGNQMLTISYPVHNETDLQPSIYVTQLQAYFGLTPAIWQSPTSKTTVKLALGSPRSLLSDGIQVLRLATDAQQVLASDWQSLFQTLRQSPLAGLSRHLLSSIDFQNTVGSLSPEIAEALYGDVIRVSVSQLETYFKNPFEYFLRYGLRLQKRPEFELSPADTGTLFHGVLDQFVSQQDLNTVTPATIQTVVAQLMADFSQQPGFEILQSSARFRFITAQLQRVLVQTLTAIVQQQKQSDFHPRATELLFGQIGGQKGLQPLIYPLPGGKAVQMRGKIDRLDTFSDGQSTYFLIVDYKSSDHRFNDSDAYYGVALQMLTYMDAVRNQTSDQPLIPAGALYFRLYNPRLDYQRDADPSQLADEMLGQFQMHGFLVNHDTPDDPILYHLDKTATPDNPAKSKLVELAYRKDGQLAKHGVNIIGVGDLEQLLAHNRQNIVNAATQIANGVIDLAPFQYDQKAETITQSDFVAIMQFDPALLSNNYHQVEKLDRQTVLDKLKEKADGNEVDE